MRRLRPAKRCDGDAWRGGGAEPGPSRRRLPHVQLRRALLGFLRRLPPADGKGFPLLNCGAALALYLVFGPSPNLLRNTADDVPQCRSGFDRVQHR